MKCTDGIVDGTNVCKKGLEKWIVLFLTVMLLKKLLKISKSFKTVLSGISIREFPTEGAIYYMDLQEQAKHPLYPY